MSDSLAFPSTKQGTQQHGEKRLNISFFLLTVLLGSGAVAAFQENFKFRFLPALSDLDITARFADRLCPYPRWPKASQL